MNKQAKLMITANILLGLLFILFNFIYNYFGNSTGHHTLWSPLWLTFYISQAATFGDIGAQHPNFSFYFFWASIIINVYFILRLQKKQGNKTATASTC